MPSGTFFVTPEIPIWFKILDANKSILPILVAENLSSSNLDVVVESADDKNGNYDSPSFTAEVVDTNGGAPSKGPFNGTLSNPQLRPGSLSLSMNKDGGGSLTAIDDGNGKITGLDVQGPVSGEIIDSEATSPSPGPYTGNAAALPMEPNTLTLTQEKDGGGTLTAKDDGAGNLVGSDVSAGTIDYATGAISVTWNSNAANPSDLTAAYGPLNTVDYVTGDVNVNWNADAAASIDLTADYSKRIINPVSITPGTSTKFEVPVLQSGSSEKLFPWTRISLENASPGSKVKVLIYGKALTEVAPINN